MSLQTNIEKYGTKSDGWGWQQPTKYLFQCSHTPKSALGRSLPMLLEVHVLFNVSPVRLWTVVDRRKPTITIAAASARAKMLYKATSRRRVIH